jgi:hypothetical protein
MGINLHLSLKEQLSINQPLGIQKYYQKILNKVKDPHEAEHKMMDCIAEMILGWPPFKIVSVSAVLYPRWPPLLKIEISSNGQNCSKAHQYAYTVQIWTLSGLK